MIVASSRISTCPYCGGRARRVFSAKDRNQRTSREPFGYCACADCSLIFIQEVPKDLGRHYVNEQYDIPARGTDFRPRAESQRWKLEILTSLIRPGRLFEVGPATGEFALLAREGGFQPKLVEMDAECCRFLREDLGLEAVESNDPVGELEASEPYDAICVWQVIEHVAEFWRLLDRAADRLASGGVLVLATPNPRSVQAKILRGYWPHVDAPRHLYLIPREWFHEFARKRGLKVELDTTRDAGSLGLNYYGWYLAVRNLTGRRLPERIVCRIARYIANRMRAREEREWHGCSYTIALRKP